jgi:phosphate-selective porin OprO/OprP
MHSISKFHLLGLSFAGFGLAAAAHAVPLGSAMVGGLFQGDFGSFSGDKDDISRTSADVRRAEIWIKGNLDHDWSYQIGYDARYTRLDASWLGYAGFAPFWLAIGYIDEPGNLEYWSGPVNSTFMEYASMTQAFQADRAVGLYADGSAAQKQIGYQVALYMPNYQTANMEDDGYAYSQGIATQDYGSDSEVFGAAGRLTLNQHDLLGLKETLHVGASIRYEGVSATQTLNPFVTTPNVLGTANAEANNVMVSSVIPVAGSAKSVNFYGLEAAGIWGPFLLQGEFMKTHMNGRAGNSSLSFLGYYGQAAYILTGEHRTYDQYTGTVGAVSKIHNPYGAWELAFRAGHVDLSDNPDVGYLATDKRGTQTDYTIGLNWYVTKNVRFLGNYSIAEANYSESTNNNDENVKVLGLRAQVDF